MKNWWRVPQMIAFFLVAGCIVSPLWDAVASSYQTTNVYLTAEGGIAIKMANNTGRTTVKGDVVAECQVCPTKFTLTIPNAYDAIGVCYESGVTQGGDAWIVIAGVCDVMLADTFAATLGGLALTSQETGGRIVCEPNPAGGLPGVDRRFQKIGIFLGNATAGTNQLVRIIERQN